MMEIRRDYNDMARFKHLDFSKLDHHPIVFYFHGKAKERQRIKERSFCFEPFWLKEVECCDIIEDFWGKFSDGSSIVSFN